MAAYVGVDLGATHVRAVVGDGERVLGRARNRTPDGPTGTAVTDAVLDTVRGACDAAGVAPETVDAAGIASFGPLDLAAGGVDRAPNLTADVDGIPLVDPVSTLLDAEHVSLHNDAAAGVIGERHYRTASPDDMVYLTISSGIGAGVCVDGHVLTGWDGNAGEVGHFVVDPEGEMACGCGGTGHWEAYCSGENLPRFARKLHADEGFETDLPVDSPDFEAADLFAVEGDPLADEVLTRMGRFNAVGVADLVHAYAPLVVAVGGAVAQHNPEAVLDPVRERLDDLTTVNTPEVEPASLGEEAVVLGALASAMGNHAGERGRR